jgi:hypothetical protein
MNITVEDVPNPTPIGYNPPNLPNPSNHQNCHSPTQSAGDDHVAKSGQDPGNIPTPLCTIVSPSISISFSFSLGLCMSLSLYISPSLYICIYIYILYTYLSFSLSLSLFVCIYIYIHKHTHTNVCMEMYLHMHLHTCICMHAGMQVWAIPDQEHVAFPSHFPTYLYYTLSLSLFSCFPLYLYFIYPYPPLAFYFYTSSQLCVMYIYICMYMYMYMYMYVCTYVYIYIYIHMIYIYIYMSIDVHIHTQCCVYVSASVSVCTYGRLHVSRYRPPLIGGIWHTHLTSPMSPQQMHVTHPSPLQIVALPWPMKLGIVDLTSLWHLTKLQWSVWPRCIKWIAIILSVKVMNTYTYSTHC